MKKISLLPVLFLLIQGFGPSFANAKAKFGPEPSPNATPLAVFHDFFLEDRAPQFYALMSYYSPQKLHTSCSAASLANILNAARAYLIKSSEDRVITENDLIKNCNINHWSEKLTGETGYKGEFGVSLLDFKEIVEQAFRKYGFPHVTVEVFQIKDLSDKISEHIVKDLKTVSMKTFIISNFDQWNFTDDVHVGHFSPIASFDEKRASVLILDTDREYFEPYWVSLKVFVNAMHTKYKDQYRGYLLINVNQ